MAEVRDAEEILNLLKDFSDEILTEAEKKGLTRYEVWKIAADKVFTYEEVKGLAKINDYAEAYKTRPVIKNERKVTAWKTQQHYNKITVQKARYIMTSEERRTKSTEELINTLNDFCSQILIMAEAKGFTRKEVKRVPSWLDSMLTSESFNDEPYTCGRNSKRGAS